MNEPKILVTVESVFYAGCCGAYEEKTLALQIVERVENTSDFVFLKRNPDLYMSREAVALIESRGNHFTIYADLKGELYSDQ